MTKSCEGRGKKGHEYGGLVGTTKPNELGRSLSRCVLWAFGSRCSPRKKSVLDGSVGHHMNRRESIFHSIFGGQCYQGH